MSAKRDLQHVIWFGLFHQCIVKINISVNSITWDSTGIDAPERTATLTKIKPTTYISVASMSQCLVCRFHLVIISKI